MHGGADSPSGFLLRVVSVITLRGIGALWQVPARCWRGGSGRSQHDRAPAKRNQTNSDRFPRNLDLFLPFGPKIRDGGRVNPKDFGFFRERYDNLAYNLANGGDQGWL
jgi:hypothetical protein